MEKNDKYFDYGHGVLKNKLDIKDKEKLRQAESDIVVTRIHQIFSDMHFTPSVEYYKSLHKFLFGDVYEFAGEFRDIQIYKEEKALAYLSVDYSKPENIESDLIKIFESIKSCDFESLSVEDRIDFITLTVSSLWQVHPFREGNTRTVLVLLRTLLNSYNITFDINMFKHSNNFQYMRDAFVAASFEAEDLGVKRNYSYVKRVINDIIIEDMEKKRGI